MGRSEEFQASAGRQPALDRASGFGNTGKAQSGSKGFGYMVRGSRVQVGDHLMDGYGKVKQVTHLSHDAMTEKTAYLHDGSTQLVQPGVHYSIGDHAEHFTKGPNAKKVTTVDPRQHQSRVDEWLKTGVGEDPRTDADRRAVHAKTDRAMRTPLR